MRNSRRVKARRTLKETAVMILLFSVMDPHSVHAGSSWPLLFSSESGNNSYACWDTPEGNCVPTPVPPAGYDNSGLIRAQQFYAEGAYAKALAESEQFIIRHQEKAKAMQASLTEYPWKSKVDIYSYADLNDVSLALLIAANTLTKVGRAEDAGRTINVLKNEYFYGQCWDPQGWFCKPAENYPKNNTTPGNPMAPVPFPQQDNGKYLQFNEDIQKQSHSGELLQNLPAGQKSFVTEYVRAIDNKDQQAYQKLFHPSLQQCINSSNQDYFENLVSAHFDQTIPEQARMSIEPISPKLLAQQEKNNTQLNVSFPVPPTHQLKIVVASNDDTVMTTEKPKMTIHSQGSSVSTSIVNLVMEKNGQFFLASSCPSEEAVKKFREAKLRKTQSSSEKPPQQEFWGNKGAQPATLAKEKQQIQPQSVQSSGIKPINTPHQVESEYWTEDSLQARVERWVGSFTTKIFPKGGGFWEDTIYYRATQSPSPSAVKKNWLGHKIEKSHFPNGQVAFEVPIQNGKRNGLMQSHNSQGDLLFVQTFRDGNPDGTGKWYDVRGNVINELQFDSGKLNRMKTFYPNGTIHDDTTLKEGKYRDYEEDGRLKTEKALDPAQIEYYRKRFGSTLFPHNARP